MKRSLIKCLLVAGLCLAFEKFASAGSVIVDSRQAMPTYSTDVLQAGVTYRLDVSGDYLFNDLTDFERADAEYYTENSWQTLQPPKLPEDDLYNLYKLLIVYGSSIGKPYTNPAQNLVAQVVYWGPYNPNHEYSFDVLGNGNLIGFVISDQWSDNSNNPLNDQQGGVFDNSGSLTVTITSVPEPSSLVLVVSGGLVVASGGLVGLILKWRRGS